MIRHVVVFRWNDSVTDADIAEVAAALDALPAAIAEIADYRHGRDEGLNTANFDYAVVGDFATPEDYLVYRDHPTHQHVIATQIAGRAAQRAAVQFEI
jgi:Stress responsive A/B Barrel Domain